MTRAQIKILAQQVMVETLGSATEGDVFGLDALLNVVTDRIAAYLDCYYVSPPAISLTANTAVYAVPNIYAIKSATVASSSGSLRLLSVVTAAKMNRLYGAGWLNTAAADVGDTSASPDCYLIALGANQFQLWPTPSAARASAVQLAGFGVPGMGWSGAGDECPLPEWTHNAVAHGLALWRCVQYADATSGMRMQRLGQVYTELLTVAAEIAGRFVTGSGIGREAPLDETRLPKAFPMPSAPASAPTP